MIVNTDVIRNKRKILSPYQYVVSGPTQFSSYLTLNLIRQHEGDSSFTTPFLFRIAVNLSGLHFTFPFYIHRAAWLTYKIALDEFGSKRCQGLVIGIFSWSFSSNFSIRNERVGRFGSCLKTKGAGVVSHVGSALCGFQCLCGVIHYIRWKNRRVTTSHLRGESQSFMTGYPTARTACRSISVPAALLKSSSLKE